MNKTKRGSELKATADHLVKLAVELARAKKALAIANARIEGLIVSLNALQNQFPETLDLPVSALLPFDIFDITMAADKMGCTLTTKLVQK
jgi:hypothetical protein